MSDLDRYCYFVAGTVGQLLTDLFLQVVTPSDHDSLVAIKDRAVSFGVGLQLVNILKDVATDFERGACFLPADIARSHGLALQHLLAPDQRRAGLAVILEISDYAKGCLFHAKEYIEHWPLASGAKIRLFCSIPLALAYATLHEIESGDEALRPGRSPTVSRERVFEILQEAEKVAANKQPFGELLDPPSRNPAPVTRLVASSS
jgi:farnesyl-diphosphate farnesyltransferase